MKKNYAHYYMLKSAALTVLVWPASAIAQTGLGDPARVHKAQVIQGMTDAPINNTEVSSDEILVTARRREESLQNIPESITAFNASAIEQAGIESVTDAFDLLPNVSIANSQDAGLVQINIRGIGQVRNGEAPIAVIIDGVQQIPYTWDSGENDASAKLRKARRRACRWRRPVGVGGARRAFSLYSMNRPQYFSLPSMSPLTVKSPLSAFALKRADKLRAKGADVDFEQLHRHEPDKGTTNVRNTASAHWKPYLGLEQRCVVPFTSFSEPDQVGGSLQPVWFALNDKRPLAFFAGIWKSDHTCVRKIKEGEVTCDLFAFLTTEANAEVGTYHSKAMPVILTEADEIETWLSAPWSEASQLQRPLPDGTLRVVARGEKKDAPADLIDAL